MGVYAGIFKVSRWNYVIHFGLGVILEIKYLRCLELALNFIFMTVIRLTNRRGIFFCKIENFGRSRFRLVI